MRAVFIFIVLCAGTSFPAVAQQFRHDVVAPAGDVDRNDRFELAWTVGELAVDSRTRQAESFTQGFHQPCLQVEFISPDAGITVGVPVDVSVFPNPVTHALHVKFEQPVTINWHLSMLSVDGTVLGHHDHKIGQRDASLNVTDLPAGIYILQLRSEDQTQLIQYKISKIQ